MKNKILQPWNLFLIVGLVFGIALSIFTPFATGFDEAAHLARIFDLSGLNMLPNSLEGHKTAFFSEFTTLTQRRMLFRDQGYDLFKAEYFRVPGNYGAMTIKETASTYPPLLFLPQAFIAGISWRFLNLPVIPVTILMRLAGLALYLVITYFAIRTIPIGRWGLLVIALSPTALYQASTVNGDGFTNAVSFLLIAQVLYAILKPEPNISKRELIALCITVILVSNAKQGAIILFPLLLLLPPRLFSTRAQFISLWLVTGFAIFLHIGWYFFAISNLAIGPGSLGISVESISSQLWGFLQGFFRSLYLYAGRLYTTMVASYGYWVAKVPKLVYWIFPLSLALSLLVDLKNEKLTTAKRFFFLGLMIVSWLVVLMFYAMALFTSGNYLHSEKVTFILKQGRYLLPYLPLLVLSLTGIYSVRNRLRQPFTITILTGIVIVQGLFFWGLYAHYYTACGPSLLTAENCRLPAYQNLDRDNPSIVRVDNSIVVQQAFSNTCRNMRTVEVYVFEVAPGSSGLVHVSLLNSSGETIVSDAFEAADLVSPTDLQLSIATAINIPSGEYFIHIEAPQLNGSISLATRQPDVYPGLLQLNGEEYHGDLVFYFSCAPAGWFRY